MCVYEVLCKLWIPSNDISKTYSRLCCLCTFVLDDLGTQLTQHTPNINTHYHTDQTMDSSHHQWCTKSTDDIKGIKDIKRHRRHKGHKTVNVIVDAILSSYNFRFSLLWRGDQSGHGRYHHHYPFVHNCYFNLILRWSYFKGNACMFRAEGFATDTNSNKDSE